MPPMPHTWSDPLEKFVEPSVSADRCDDERSRAAWIARSGLCTLRSRVGPQAPKGGEETNPMGGAPEASNPPSPPARVEPSAADRAREESWRRYWRVFGRFEKQVRSPRDLYADRINEHARGQAWLDAGCGRHSFPEWREHEEQQLIATGTWLVGCDSDVSAVRDRPDHRFVCAADLEHLPYADASFGMVSAN